MLLEAGKLAMRTACRCVLCFGVSATAFGSLGDNVKTVQSDQVHMKAALRTTQGAGYEIHELQSESGVRVREYVSPAGQVFAVSWQGPFMPDLQKLLGVYFEQFAQAAKSKRVRRGPLIIRLPGLVVESSGHMRSFAGRAYVPQMLPQDVRAESIR